MTSTDSSVEDAVENSTINIVRRLKAADLGIQIKETIDHVPVATNFVITPVTLDALTLLTSKTINGHPECTSTMDSDSARLFNDTTTLDDPEFIRKRCQTTSSVENLERLPIEENMIQRRRLKNRESAARSRQKKNKQLESALEEIKELKRTLEHTRRRLETVQDDYAELQRKYNKLTS
jgi:hypothetical protein